MLHYYGKINESNDTAMKCLCDRWRISRPFERKYEGHAMNIGKGRKSERPAPTGRSPNKVRLSFSRRARAYVGRERRITFVCPTTFAKFKYPTARLLFVTRRPRTCIVRLPKSAGLVRLGSIASRHLVSKITIDASRSRNEGFRFGTPITAERGARGRRGSGERERREGEGRERDDGARHGKRNRAFE